MDRRHLGALAVAALLMAPPAARADTGPCGRDTGGPLPDLIVDAAKLAQTLAVADEKYTQSSCAVQEGLVSGPGWRTLMRFATATPNLGPGALVVGNPASCPAVYELSTCHGHYHFHGYAEYRLWTPGGYDTWLAVRDLASPTSTGANAAALAQALRNKSLVVGRKMGFCFVDNERYADTASPTPTFVSCFDNQGISVGWSDSYRASLDGQYVEVDGLKTGDYVLEVHVNPEHALPETDYTNNSSAVRIRYTARRGAIAPTVELLP